MNGPKSCFNNTLIYSIPRIDGLNRCAATKLDTPLGTLLISERLRLTTARIVAVAMSRKVLSNTWWPVSIETGESKSKYQIRLLLCGLTRRSDSSH
jgi:hypothetical protein